MRKKIKYLVTFIFFNVIFICNVNADLWGSSGIPLPCTDCDGGGSKNGVGNVVLATAYRVSLVDQSGHMVPGTHAVDYWPVSDDRNYDGHRGLGWRCVGVNESGTGCYWISGAPHHYQTKAPKTDPSSSGGIVRSFLEMGTDNKWEWLIAEEGSSDEKTRKWTAYSGRYGDTQHSNNIARSALEIMDKYFHGEGCNDANNKAVEIAQHFLDDMGYGKILEDAKLDNLYFVVEPIQSLSNSVDGGYVGTAAELARAGYTTKYKWAYPRVSYLHPVVYVYDETPGTVIAGVNACTGLSATDFTAERAADPTNCVGAYIFDLRLICANDECITEADNLVANSPYMSITDIKNKVKEMSDKYNLPTYSLYFDGLVPGLEKVSVGNSIVLDAFGLPATGASLCHESINCTDLAQKLYYCYYLGNHYGPDNQYLGPNCKVDHDLYEDYIEKMQNDLFPSAGDMLITSVWQASHSAGPKCDDPIVIDDDCPSTLPNLICGTPFKFQDNTTKPNSCWKAGIAYSKDGINVSSVENTTTKSDASCIACNCTGSHSCRTYCQETVEFKFPEAPEKTKAGQVFKWGIEEDKNSNVFGTMKVTKKCTAKSSKNTDCMYHSSCATHTHCEGTGCGEDGDSCCNVDRTDNAVDENLTGITTDTITAESWANKVKTEIELLYEEPTNDTLYPSPNPKIVIDTSNIVSSGEYTGVTCDSKDCKNDTEKSMSNTYTFVYQEDLDWYSYKVNNSLKNKPNVTGDDGYYYHIGYGLPTAFTTPSGVYGTNTTSTGEPKLIARIKNIGTQKKNESGNDIEGYRYDDLLVEINGEKAIDYTCYFEIYNELYDYECCDEAGNKYADAPDYCPDSCSDDEPDGKRKGIDVVFRTIELMGGATDADRDRAFPGRLGSGRTARTNWKELYDDTTELHKVLDSSVYSKEPQYEIKLTVANIQKIRQFNKAAKSAGIDPYTEMNESSGSGSTGFICYDSGSGDQYKYCASHFLTSLTRIDPINPENNLKGICIDEGGSDASGRAAYFKTTGCHQS